MYSCKPSRDKIGHPSRNAVFTSELDPGIDSKLKAGPQAENDKAAMVGVAIMVVTMARVIEIFLLHSIFVNM
jgi:hypothetical protein